MPSPPHTLHYSVQYGNIKSLLGAVLMKKNFLAYMLVVLCCGGFERGWGMFDVESSKKYKEKIKEIDDEIKEIKDNEITIINKTTQARNKNLIENKEQIEKEKTLLLSKDEIEKEEKEEEQRWKKWLLELKDENRKEIKRLNERKIKLEEERKNYEESEKKEKEKFEQMKKEQEEWEKKQRQKEIQEEQAVLEQFQKNKKEANEKSKTIMKNITQLNNPKDIFDKFITILEIVPYAIINSPITKNENEQTLLTKYNEEIKEKVNNFKLICKTEKWCADKNKAIDVLADIKSFQNQNIEKITSIIKTIQNNDIKEYLKNIDFIKQIPQKLFSLYMHQHFEYDYKIRNKKTPNPQNVNEIITYIKGFLEFDPSAKNMLINEANDFKDKEIKDNSKVTEKDVTNAVDTCLKAIGISITPPDPLQQALMLLKAKLLHLAQTLAK